MKEKCHSLRISTVVFIVSFIICCLLWSPLPAPFPQFIIQFFQVFFGGTLSSSFVTLLIYASEYQTQKRITLENIWSEIHRIMRRFRAIHYLHFEVPADIVAGYFHEEWFNSDCGRLGQQAVHTYRDQWAERIAPTYSSIKEGLNANDYRALLIEHIEHQANDYLRSMDTAIDDYISIAESNFDELDRLFGVLEFLTGKRSYRKIYQDLYTPIKDKHRIIQKQVYPHFSSYKAGENKNKAVILSKLIELQNHIFMVQTSEEFINIYNHFCCEMEQKLENFRVQIYKNNSPEHLNPYPVLTITNLPSDE